MRSFAPTRRVASYIVTGACLLLLLPIAAAAQTSGISGTVNDTSGAVLPGVTVEVASPALIEKVRTATTNNSGRYSITALRPGVYSITFTLPGFSTVRRENIELTSDFIATIDADLRVGAVEETITVSAESPLVDVQSITTRTVMTREIMDMIPTGRNIQAVGILIPGTSLALGGGGALSRDVGGSGNLQQSPLQYRGSGDTVQTIEGLRLNNLCAQGAYSGVYWNDASFQEYSYVTGADSAEMGQGGMRVNMVPRDGGNTFRGTFMANFANEGMASDNCNSPGIGQACTQQNLWGDLTYNANNKLTNISQIQDVWDINPTIGGPIMRDRLWFNYTFRHWGVNKSVADSYADLNPSQFVYTPDYDNPGIDDGHIVSNAARIAWQVTSKDKISYYHDNQRKYRDHWGISAATPPEAAGVQVTPTSFVSVTKWSRTHTNRLLFEGGLGIYDQNYTELYQPSVTGLDDKVFDLDAIRNARIYTVSSQATGKIANAWSAPADHYSLLRTFMGAASYVTGSHSLRFGGTVTQGRLAARRSRIPATCSRSPTMPRTGPCPPRSGCRSIAATASRPTPACSSRIAGRWAGSPGTSACATTGSSARRRRAKCSRAASTRARSSASALTARTTRAPGVRERFKTGRTSRRAWASRWTSSATAGRRSRRASPSTWRARTSRWPTPRTP